MLRGLLPPVFLIILITAILPFALTLGPAEQAFDRALGDGAYAIATIIHTTAPADVMIDPQAERAIRADSLDRILFAVIGPDGRLLAGDAALAAAPRPGDALPNPWIHTEQVGAEPLRIFALLAPCARFTCQIRIGETLHKRDALQRGALLASILPACLLGVFIVLFVVYGVRRALEPLQGYTSALLRMDTAGWQALDPAQAAMEVRPLIQALNLAGERLRSATASQQRFLSTAAHQLRTPLAGLKGTADLAGVSTDPEQVRHLLRQVSRSADRVARLAGQLLAIARSDQQIQDPAQRRDCDLAELVEDLMEDALRQAAAAEIDLGFELKPAPLLGHPLLLREMMANLLDNAIRYTPPGGRVTLRTGTGTAHVPDGATSASVGKPGVVSAVQSPQVPMAWMEVEDDGPGIPAEHHSSVLDRFVRLPGSGGHGSGLGLAIVQEICQAHDAALSFREGAGHDAARPGLCAHVAFR